MADGTDKDGRKKRLQSPKAEVAYLDTALWSRFREADTPEAFRRAWLGLQCGRINAARAVLVSRDAGPFRPSAFWPQEKSTSKFLMSLVEEALTKKVDQIRDNEGAQGQAGVARLIRRDGRIVAVVALELQNRTERELQQALLELDWGAGWLEAFDRRSTGAADEAAKERLTLALDAVAISGEHLGFRAASTAVLSELAVQLGCARVSFGVRRAGGARLKAVSNTAHFARNSAPARALARAMDEAMDQGAVVQSPKPETDDPILVTRRADELTRARGGGASKAIPFLRDGQAAGAFVFEWAEGEAPPPHLDNALEDVAALAGPALHDRWRESRWLSTKASEVVLGQIGRLIGPGYLGRKLTLAALAAVATFFALFVTEFRVSAPGELRGVIERVIAAPLDGYLLETRARAGDEVPVGGVMARLDPIEFELERFGWEARKIQHEAEYEQALSNFDRAGAAILSARIREAEAQIALNETRIALTRIEAPIAGVVVEGDLTQSLGRAVRRGEELFRISPLEGFRLRLNVEEADVPFVTDGAKGEIVLSALPETPLSFSVEKVTPVAEAVEGVNGFIVEAVLSDPPPTLLRPGMQGVAKVEAGEARLIWIWTRRAVHWLRLQWWRWAP